MALIKTCDQKQTGVHHGGPGKHGGHQDVVAWAIHETDVSLQFHGTTALLTLHIVLLVTPVTAERVGRRTARAFIYFCVRIAFKISHSQIAYLA